MATKTGTAAKAKASKYEWPKQFNLLTWLGAAVNAAHSWGDLLSKDTGMKMHIGGTTMTVNRFRWLKLGISQQTEGAPSETSQMVMGRP